MSAALAACLLVALLLAPTAGARSKAKIGEFGTPKGPGKGQLDQPRGVAVNRTGAGGVNPGDVYVVDGGDPSVVAPGNNRIVEFSATGAFVRMWGIDVVASGPDDKGTSAFEVCLPADVCKASLQSEVAGGMSKPQGIAIDQTTGNVYVIDVNANSFATNSRVNVYSATGAFEGAFGWKVNATTPEEKLQFCTAATGCQKGSRGGGASQLQISSNSLAAVGPGNGHLYIPEGGLAGEENSRVEEFEPILNGSKEAIGVNFVKAIGWDVVAGGPGPDQSNEIQLVKIRAGAGKFKLSFGGESTGELPYNASPKEIEDALNELASIEALPGGGSVTVSDGPGDATASTPYKVTFHTIPKGTDVAQLVPIKGSLSGGSGHDPGGSGNETSAKVETYNDGGEGLESCVAANGDVCKAGTTGGGLGQFSSGNPTSVAVDKEGALYAVNQSSIFGSAPGRVYKFTFPAPGEVAVEEFAPKYLTQEEGDPNAVDPTDVAVDPTDDNVLVAKKEGTERYKFLEFDSSGTFLDNSPAGETTLKASFAPTFHGLAIGTEERFYFSNPLGEVDIFGLPPAPAVEIGPVEEVGTTTATFNGTVTPAEGLAGEHFATSYHFEYSRNGIGWKPFPASDIAIGDGSGAGDPKDCPTGNAPKCEVTQKAFGLEPNADYLVRLVATNGTAATSSAVPFKTKAAPPSVSGTIATQIAKTTAKLTGLVNPNNQPTTYHFEWGETTAYGNEVPGFEAFAGSGGEATKVVAPIGGLKEGTAYHFRIVATNPSGESKGPDQEFTTLDSFSLPEARAPEQVSPNDKRPVGMVAQILQTQIYFQAAGDGESILYPLQNGLPDSTAGGNLEYLGRRGGAGWTATQITPPSLVPVPGGGLVIDATGEVIYGSADLGCELIESFEPLGPITPELEELVENGVTNLYRRNADGTYTLLNPLPLGSSSGGATTYHVDWVSADCNHILFDTNYKLLAGAPASGRGLYEWADGTLALAGVLPDESVANNALAGAGDTRTNWNSLSEDGSKAFFTAKSNAGPDTGSMAIFMRRGGAETLDASQSQTGTPNNDDSKYQTASADGAHLFFTARYGLAGNGTSAGAGSCASGPPVFGFGDGTGCDLYDYDTDTEVLTDLSADANPADTKGASVVGVLDASDDGSRIYFAARGQLVPNKGKTEAQNLLGSGTYNLYLSDEGELAFVGLISDADTDEDTESGNDLSARMTRWVADATPDGKHLLFVSKANVTGYESGGVAEAYLYSAASGDTVCVSCRVDGQPSIGDTKTQPLKMQARKNFTGTISVQNRPRSISDDGRHIFFTMPDVLAAGAKAGTHNIYEWSGGQVYLLVAGEEGGHRDFTEFADSSTTGNDVFAVTKAKLVPQDFDNTTDLYDLRAPHVTGEKVGPEAAKPEPEPCDPLAHQCRGPATPQPPANPPPPSEGFSGPGNPPTEAAKPHHKGKKHKGKSKKGKGKKHNHKARAAR